MNPGVKFHRFLTKQKEKVKKPCKSPDALLTVLWGCSWMWKACPRCTRLGLVPRKGTVILKSTLWLDYYWRSSAERILGDSLTKATFTVLTSTHSYDSKKLNWSQDNNPSVKDIFFFFLNFKSLDFWNNFYLSSDVFKVTETRGLCKGFHGRPAL